MQYHNCLNVSQLFSYNNNQHSILLFIYLLKIIEHLLRIPLTTITVPIHIGILAISENV